jgi:hypothetical protein
MHDVIHKGEEIKAVLYMHSAYTDLNKKRLEMNIQKWKVHPSAYDANLGRTVSMTASSNVRHLGSTFSSMNSTLLKT